MKKTVFFRNILILIFTLISLSCSNLFEQELETPSSESRNAFITLSVGSGDGSRTVLPGVEESELTTLALKGTKEGESERSLGSWASVSEMRNAAIPLSTGSWTFTLTAKKGGTSFCGSTSKNINVGENSLSFEMKISDSGTGAGSFSITLNFGSAPNADKVTKALATLENTDGSAVTGVNSQNLTPSENAVTFSARGISAGTYRAKVVFYSTQDGRDFEIATYRELVQISDSLASTATRTIESFDNLYTITYNLNGGALAEGVTLRENVTRKSNAITLPELAKDYYTFDGWYTTENFAEGTQVTSLENFTGNVSVYAKFSPITYTITYVLNGGTNADGAVTTYTMNDNVTLSQPVFDDKPFYGWYDSEDFSGNKVTGWSAGEKGGDITLYANFESLIVTSVNIEEACRQIESMTQSGRIKAIGEFSEELLKDLTKATKGISSEGVLVSLDLSESTGYDKLPLYSFYKHGKIRELILPNCITIIGQSEFYSCVNLETIVIPSSVTKILSGAFADCTSLDNVVIPDSVSEIVQGVFENCTSLKTIKLGKNNTKIGKISFKGCTSLTNIDFVQGKTTEIGTSAFENCTGLTSITIPSNVEKIGSNAFKGTNLQSVIFNVNKKKYARWVYTDQNGVGRDNFAYNNTESAAYYLTYWARNIYIQY